MRIADDGEILVRGPCVMMGYYKKPDETARPFRPDGWFSTGDIGHLDKDGYLVITDRKKELLKTAGGKLVAPAPIENALKTSPYIQNAALVGDKRRFIAALIVPNFTTVEARARAGERDVRLARRLLATDPWVHKLIESEIARLTANLAQYETIKRFALLERDFTFDGGELTYTLKLKRRVIEQHYADVIEGLYAEPSPTRSSCRAAAGLVSSNFGRNIPVRSRCSSNCAPNSSAKNASSRRAFTQKKSHTIAERRPAPRLARSAIAVPSNASRMPV